MLVGAVGEPLPQHVAVSSVYYIVLYITAMHVPYFDRTPDLISGDLLRYGSADRESKHCTRRADHLSQRDGIDISGKICMS